MTEIARTDGSTPAAVIPKGAAWTREAQERAILATATAAAWVHTVDEVRIGELIAVPFGVLNVGLVAGWPRLTRGWRAVSAIAFGLFWGLAVIPYHVLPLLQGTVTGQHVSGLSRVLAGAAMIGLGILILVRRSGETAADATASR